MDRIKAARVSSIPASACLWEQMYNRFQRFPERMALLVDGRVSEEVKAEVRRDILNKRGCCIDQSQ